MAPLGYFVDFYNTPPSPPPLLALFHFSFCPLVLSLIIPRVDGEQALTLLLLLLPLFLPPLQLFDIGVHHPPFTAVLLALPP